MGAGGTRLVLADSICRIFNVYDLYRRSSLAIRHIVGSLTSTIDANFRNDCSGSSEISAWAFQRIQWSSRCVLSSDSSSLAYWILELFESRIFCHNTINGWSWVSKKSNYLSLLSLARKPLMIAALPNYIPIIHLVSISRLLRIWLEDFLGRQQSLAETQYSEKLKIVRILVTHLIYIYIYIYIEKKCFR